MATATTPRVRFASPFALLRRFRTNPLALLFELFRTHGDAVRIEAPFLRGLFLVHPDAVKAVLEDHHDRYVKGRIFDRVKRVTGDGVIFAEGEAWRTRRRLATPGFQRERVGRSDRVITERSEALVERWLSRPDPDAPFELSGEMSRLALDIVTRALFGSRGLSDFEAFREAMDVGAAYFNDLTNRLVPTPWALPTPANLRMRRSRAVVHGTVDALVRERRASDERDDLLGLLLAAADEEGGLDDAQLRDEAITFVTAGHETTAMALTWTLWLLAQHPPELASLRDELEAVLAGRAPTRADVKALPFLRCVVDESLRLYPPAWAIPREAAVDDVVQDHAVPRGTAVFLSPYVTHRHPDFWEAPERFWPERFEPARGHGRPRLAFFPFGTGPRICLGAHFARLELQLALATLVQRVDLEIAPGPPVVPDPIFTLRPRDGVMVRVRERARSRATAQPSALAGASAGSGGKRSRISAT